MSEELCTEICSRAARPNSDDTVVPELICMCPFQKALYVFFNEDGSLLEARQKVYGKFRMSRDWVGV